MLREIVLLIFSSFFLKSAWAPDTSKFLDSGNGQSPIDIYPYIYLVEFSSQKQLFFTNQDEQPLEFYTSINRTGDQIGKIFT